MKVDLKLAREYGLSEAEWEMILARLGRVPSHEELGVISVMWSEHCSYKSSRRHLKKLPTAAPWVLQGPGENAGVIDVGGGLAVCFKMESHNHPSFIEPFQGAATGVGGIMRDIFTMGARPVANLNSLRFGAIDAPRMRFLVEGVVAGIGSYGNCMGVPTVGGEVAFDPSYDGNILVNAMTVGVMKSDRIFRSAAAGVGSPVIYVGSKTGRDGIHGATMASEEFGEGELEARSEDGRTGSAPKQSKRPRVQVGDPFTEKVLLEACLELMQEDAIVAIQDMGAAGLTCSTCEMAAKGGLGIDIDVRHVPRRETGMTPYEILLSESQERMLMVVKPGREDLVRRIFHKWDLSVAVIGTITDSGRMIVREGDRIAVDLPVGLLTDDAPNYDRPHRAPPDLEARWRMPELPQRPMDRRLIELLSRPTIASKRWVYEQYDSSVRASTVAGPGAADAAVVRLPDERMAPAAREKRGIALTTDMNSRYVALDPRRGALLGLLESARNLVCVGATPKAVTDCLNFGNPEKPEVMWTLVEAIEGLAEGARALDTPIVSGNVSLYNETGGRPILPTPTIGMVGIVDDVARIARIGFAQDGDRIVLLGDVDQVSFGGSELLLMETGKLAGRPAAADLDRAKAVHAACLESIRGGLVSSAHDAAEGGLLVAIAECCIRGRRGARIRLPGSDATKSAFAEGPSLIVLSARAENVPKIRAIAEAVGAPLSEMGEVGTDRLIVEGHLEVPIEELRNAWENSLIDALKGRNAQRRNEA
jgi:phosphoribosylformylglycinamidine synthase